MKIITLSQGMFSVVSDSDFEEINRHKWYAKKSAHCWYAVRNVWNRGKPYCVRMHRIIANCPSHLETHHRDGLSMNNQRENLENTTKLENVYIRNHR